MFLSIGEYVQRVEQSFKYVGHEVNKRWQSSTPHVNFSFNLQILKSHFNCGNFYSNPLNTVLELQQELLVILLSSFNQPLNKVLPVIEPEPMNINLIGTFRCSKYTLP
uniref:Uncharacterized protein n=1 Tax=Opuntia streptacantha TaxID=393608 RepID=A0A7C8Z602_OPUST